MNIVINSEKQARREDLLGFLRKAPPPHSKIFSYKKIENPALEKFLATSLMRSISYSR